MRKLGLMKGFLTIVCSGLLAMSMEAMAQGNEGSAKSATEIAAELSNPNTAVATLTFKNQIRWFKADLPFSKSNSITSNNWN